MPLVQCPECNSPVSDLAVACPRCACPIRGVTTIERTGKEWKALQLFGAAIMCVGPVVWLTGNRDYESAMIATSVMAGGFVSLVAGRLGAWWYHG